MLATAGLARAQYGDLGDLKIAKPQDKVNVDIRIAPDNALILFGGKNLDRWVMRNDEKKPATWDVLPPGVAQAKDGDIVTKQHFDGHFKLHVEFRVLTCRTRWVRPRQQRRLCSGTVRSPSAGQLRTEEPEQRLRSDLRSVGAVSQRLQGADGLAELRYRLHGAEMRGRQEDGTGPDHGLSERLVNPGQRQDPGGQYAAPAAAAIRVRRGRLCCNIMVPVQYRNIWLVQERIK